MTAWRSFDTRLRTAGPIHIRSIPRGGRKVVRWHPPGLGGHAIGDLVYLPGGRITAPARVVITEGERAADAVRAAGFDAIGTVCGAGTIPSRSVAEFLTGCHVILWPDADDPGWRHMRRMSRLLAPVVASMAVIVLPPGVPSGWDAADTTSAEVRRLVRAARDLWLARP